MNTPPATETTTETPTDPWRTTRLEAARVLLERAQVAEDERGVLLLCAAQVLVAHVDQAVQS